MRTGPQPASLCIGKPAHQAVNVGLECGPQAQRCRSGRSFSGPINNSLAHVPIRSQGCNGNNVPAIVGEIDPFVVYWRSSRRSDTFCLQFSTCYAGFTGARRKCRLSGTMVAGMSGTARTNSIWAGCPAAGATTRLPARPCSAISGFRPASSAMLRPPSARNAAAGHAAHGA